MIHQLPITFTFENRRKTVNLEKTHTRRLGTLKKMPVDRSFITVTRVQEAWTFSTADGFEWTTKCPYGVPQENPVEFWLREPTQVLDIGLKEGEHSAKVFYYDDSATRDVSITKRDYHSLADFLAEKGDWIKTYPRYMRKSFARIWITGIRNWAEQLKSMEPEDAIAEGCSSEIYGEYGFDHTLYDPALANYMRLWNQINDASPWNDDQWVWGVEFNLKSKD